MCVRQDHCWLATVCTAWGRGEAGLAATMAGNGSGAGKGRLQREERSAEGPTER